MPELPEVGAIAAFLDDRIAGLPIRRVDVASLAVLKTADPPYTALTGRTVVSAGRIGKYLLIRTVPGDADTPADHSADDPDEVIYLVIHLSRAGWLRWSEPLAWAARNSHMRCRRPSPPVMRVRDRRPTRIGCASPRCMPHWRT